MDGKYAIINILAVKNVAKFENWYDEIMNTALEYAIQTIAEKEGIDLEEIKR